MAIQATFTIQGEIEDFTRIDNVYRALKREGIKFLHNPKIIVKVDYQEVVGTAEIPK